MFPTFIDHVVWTWVSSAKHGPLLEIILMEARQKVAGFKFRIEF